MRLYEVALIAASVLSVGQCAALPFAAVRANEAVAVEGELLDRLSGRSLAAIRVLACHARRCLPIPMQIDERDARGAWVLDQGPEASADNPPMSFDANDVLLFMASDAGERTRSEQLPAHDVAIELAIRDPLDSAVAWVYVVASESPPPPATGAYVAYDPHNDRIRGIDRGIAWGNAASRAADGSPTRSPPATLPLPGAGVSMGFAGGVPSHLAIGEGPNLLDRLKVRASARWLFGWFWFSRSEADLSTEFAGWHAGPIRIIRSQRQRIRLGFGIRSPTFGSYTYFYRSSAELPVGLHLNFRATYFVSDVEIRAILDFRDLTGWQLVVPDQSPAILIGGGMDVAKESINRLEASWFALRGPELTLVQSLEVSASLASTRRTLIYREGAAAIEAPESYPGEHPGVGYRLQRWQDVGAGRHQFAALSYAVANDIDLETFVRAKDRPLVVYVSP